jgi:hypothetical protein
MMSAMRCPKCELINGSNARLCRRCGTSLSSTTGVNASDSRVPNLKQAARRLVIPAIAIISALCIYGLCRYAQSDVNYGTGPARAKKAIQKSLQANSEFEEVRKLNQDFIAQLDKNLADRNGKGLAENQPLAFDTLMSLKQRKDKISDPIAQKYLDELCRLVDKYYDQVVRYNSESAHLAEVDRRIRSEMENIRQDSSLLREDMLAKQRTLRGKLYEETQECSVTSFDLNETVKYLRDLSVMDISMIDSSYIEYAKPEKWPK